jgi:hypothetical protein
MLMCVHLAGTVVLDLFLPSQLICLFFDLYLVPPDAGLDALSSTKHKSDPAGNRTQAASSAVRYITINYSFFAG